MALSLQVSNSEAITAQCSPPPSQPAKSAFLRLSAIGRDGALDHVRGNLDAGRRRESGEALPAREGVADGLGELALLADEAELLLEPWL